MQGIKNLTIKSFLCTSSDKVVCGEFFGKKIFTGFRIRIGNYRRYILNPLLSYLVCTSFSAKCGVYLSVIVIALCFSQVLSSSLQFLAKKPVLNTRESCYYLEKETRFAIVSIKFILMKIFSICYAKRLSGFRAGFLNCYLIVWQHNN